MSPGNPFILETKGQRSRSQRKNSLGVGLCTLVSACFFYYVPSTRIFYQYLPTGVTSHFSSRSFSVSAPSTWNSLPQHIRSIDRLSAFKRQLKSHFFQSAFTV